jgi:hypothetical protein
MVRTRNMVSLSALYEDSSLTVGPDRQGCGLRKEKRSSHGDPKERGDK